MTTKRLVGIKEHALTAVEQTLTWPRKNILEQSIAQAFGINRNERPFVVNEEPVRLRWIRPQ